MNTNSTVCAVIVTYNRLELLKGTIESLLGQTHPLNHVLVINNGSTDGTEDWLRAQAGVEFITQENVGGAGGFHTGLETAFNRGFDWIWCMDDDVVAKPDCLQELLNFSAKTPAAKVLCPLRFTPEGKPIGNEQVTLDFASPWKDHGPVRLRDLLTDGWQKRDATKVEGFTFEGPFIHSSVVAAIGLPDKEFFIIGDDTDFSARCVGRFDAYVVHSATMTRMIPEAVATSITWKDYYYVRNTLTRVNVRHGSFAVKWFRPGIRALAFLRNRFLIHRSDAGWVGFGLVVKGVLHGYLGLEGRRH